MSLTSRMKFALLQRFVINLVFFAVFLWIYLFHLHWEIRSFEQLKNELHNKFDHYQYIIKNGIDFQTAQAHMNQGSSSQDAFLQNILSQIDDSFYKANFTNTESDTFLMFLQEKVRETEQIMSSSTYMQRNDVLDTLLPIYSPFISLGDNDMSSSDFINYIENILYLFNITHSGQIGIENLVPVVTQESLWEEAMNMEQSDGAAPQQNSIDERIFAVPVNLEIQWRKWNIVNFIHFLTYVWNVSPDFENNSLSVHNDSFFEWFANRSIVNRGYLWQILSIEEIRFPTYLDSSVSQSNENFISRVRSPAQFSQVYNISLKLNFYVAGYPQFRISESIRNLLDELSQDLRQMDTALRTSSAAFGNDNLEQRANQRTAARIVSQLLRSYEEQDSRDMSTLWQEETIQMYNNLLDIKNMKDSVKQRYHTFFNEI